MGRSSSLEFVVVVVVVVVIVVVVVVDVSFFVVVTCPCLKWSRALRDWWLRLVGGFRVRLLQIFRIYIRVLANRAMPKLYELSYHFHVGDCYDFVKFRRF